MLSIWPVVFFLGVCLSGEPAPAQEAFLHGASSSAPSELIRTRIEAGKMIGQIQTDAEEETLSTVPQKKIYTVT